MASRSEKSMRLTAYLAGAEDSEIADELKDPNSEARQLLGSWGQERAEVEHNHVGQVVQYFRESRLQQPVAGEPVVLVRRPRRWLAGLFTVVTLSLVAAVALLQNRTAKAAVLRINNDTTAFRDCIEPKFKVDTLSANQLLKEPRGVAKRVAYAIRLHRLATRDRANRERFLLRAKRYLESAKEDLAGINAQYCTAEVVAMKLELATESAEFINGANELRELRGQVGQNGSVDLHVRLLLAEGDARRIAASNLVGENSESILAEALSCFDQAVAMTKATLGARRMEAYSHERRAWFTLNAFRFDAAHHESVLGDLDEANKIRELLKDTDSQVAILHNRLGQSLSHETLIFAEAREGDLKLVEQQLRDLSQDIEGFAEGWPSGNEHRLLDRRANTIERLADNLGYQGKWGQAASQYEVVLGMQRGQYRLSQGLWRRVLVKHDIAEHLATSDTPATWKDDGETPVDYVVLHGLATASRKPQPESWARLSRSNFHDAKKLSSAIRRAL